MKNNKITKVFLMLFMIGAVAFGVTGCGNNSLSDDQVIEKIKTLAMNERDKMGYSVEVRSVNNHSGSFAIWFYNLFASGKERLPNCDEVWVGEFHSDKWENCVVRLCRRGSYYFLNFNR